MKYTYDSASAEIVMRRLGLIIGTILPIVTGIFGLELIASESGEVAVVTTFGSSEDSFSTRL